jgi:uncharacterized membrane protein YfcA
VIAALAVAVVAGVIAGLLGVGGGVLFVPAMTIFLGFSQLHAEATSLVAIVPVSVVGAWRQHRYGNLRVREGAVLGVLSVVGVLGGVAAANAVPERALEVGFALIMLGIAVHLVRRALNDA